MTETAQLDDEVISDLAKFNITYSTVEIGICLILTFCSYAYP